MRKGLYGCARSALLAAITLCLGCASAGELTSTQANSLDGSGTYDFTATFQTFTGPDPASFCGVGACPHKTVPIAPGSLLAGSSLAGVMVLAPPTQSAGSFVYPVAPMELSEVDCRIGTSCFTRTVAYSATNLTLSPTKTLSAITRLDYASGEGVYLNSGQAAGDSITGNLDWYVFFGSAAQYYSGTFVARRRR